MAERKLISIVTPCFNEELNVDFHFEAVTAALAPLSRRYEFEHIYTDNCSTDGTWAALVALAARHDHVRVMRFARNIGADNAIYFGLQNAKGDAVMLIQADLQDPPELIPEFVAGWEADYDVVYGQVRTRKEGFVMRRLRGLFYWLIARFGEVPIPQNAGEYRLCSRRALDALLTFDEQEIYMRGLVALVGYRQKPLQYERAERRAGKSSVSLGGLFSYAINGMVSTTLIPIRLVTVVGLITAAFGFLLAIATVVLKIAVPSVAPKGYATTAVLVAFFSGVQLFAIGIIGEYLRKTYRQALDRPRGFIADWAGGGWADPVRGREAELAPPVGPHLSLGRQRREGPVGFPE
jgi:glycosyltransferase involved in cell wall biosynthesis